MATYNVYLSFHVKLMALFVTTTLGHFQSTHSTTVKPISLIALQSMSTVPEGLFVLVHSGVGFSFIFSGVLMVVVTTLFLVGGNMEKLVCEPYHTKELFKASYRIRLSVYCANIPKPNLNKHFCYTK